jgi:hypothetical protein
MKKNKYFIKPLDSFSAKQKMNHKDKVNLVLEKEQRLQIQFIYSINNYELLVAQIERDLLMAKIVKEETEDADNFNKNKP